MKRLPFVIRIYISDNPLNFIIFCCIMVQIEGTFKPRYSEQVRQTLFIHYVEELLVYHVICLVNPQWEQGFVH